MRPSRTGGSPGGQRPEARLLKFRYDLETKLSDGPVLDSWRGYDRLSERPVLVKLVRARWAVDEKAGRRWMLRLGKLRGKAVRHAPTVLETGRDQETFFYVREFAEGMSLERWMEEPHSVNSILGCVILVLRALAEWHAGGLCHGQLHPGNILLQRREVQFCDWDVAAATLNCLGGVVTRQRHRVYLAPEVRESSTAGPASDVYSVGVALWEMLTGRRLAAEVDDRPAPSEVNPELPPGVDVVVEGMLKPDPDDRYPAAQAAQALAQLRSKAEPQAERTPRERRRQRTRDRRELPRAPLPWPITAILVFYRFLFILLLTGMVTLGTLAGMSWFGYRYLVDSIPPEVIIPDVTGKPLDKAKDLFTNNLHLGFNVTLKQASASIPSGSVITTRPEAGRKVREGRTIEVVVSTGAEQVTVPRLVERPFDESQTTLEKLGLKLGQVSKGNSNEVAAGSVVNQDPGPGRKVSPGSTVSLKVSTGPSEAQSDAKPAESDKGNGGTTAQPQTVKVKKVGRVKITVPSTPRLTWVKIVLQDDDGERIVYNELRYAGDVVVKNVEGHGDTMVEVYLNGTKVETKVL